MESARGVYPFVESLVSSLLFPAPFASGWLGAVVASPGLAALPSGRARLVPLLGPVSRFGRGFSRCSCFFFTTRFIFLKMAYLFFIVLNTFNIFMFKFI